MKEEEVNKYRKLRKCTMTDLFIVPTLKIGNDKLTEAGFISAYLKDEIHEVDYDRGVYLLFKPKSQLDFDEFLTEERERKALIIDEYDYQMGLVMLVYQYPLKWKNDVEILMTGRFTKVSREFQNNISKTETVRGKMGRKETEVMTIQHQIFKCSPELVEFWREEEELEIDYKLDECWEFYSERETFNAETLKKINNEYNKQVYKAIAGPRRG